MLTIPGESLEAKLIDRKIPYDVIYVVDSSYVFPTLEWVEGPFSDGLSKFLGDWVAYYRAERSDCDDFADAAAFYARGAHRFTEGQEGVAIAFGEFYYNPDSGGSHATNCFFTKVNDALELMFYEPQTQKIVKLSPTEIASCAYCQF